MISKELTVFLFVGILTVLIDFLSYRTLAGFDVLDINFAKAIGFLIGTLFAYFANRFWTFGHTPHKLGSIRRFAVLYASTLGANVAVNALILHMLPDVTYRIQWAFLFATGTSACLNFLGMKLFVFRPHATSESK